MRILATDKRETEFVFTVQERKTLQKAGALLKLMAQHIAGEAEKKALEAFKPIVEKWAPEEKETANADK